MHVDYANETTPPEATDYAEEQTARSLLFGTAMTHRADVIVAAKLSEDGRMAAASPGPGLTVLSNLWSSVCPSVGDRIADLGAGLGGASWWMQRRGAVVTAIEEQVQCVAAGRRLFPQLQWLCQPLADVDYAGFDGVTMFGVLSLEEHPVATFRSVLKGLERDLRHRRWVAVVDLVATHTPVVTERNRFVTRNHFHDAANGWTVGVSRELGVDEQRSWWRDVEAAVDIAARMTSEVDLAKVIADDRRALNELSDNGAICPALMTFEKRGA